LKNLIALLGLAAMVLPAVSSAAITGQVLDAANSQPLANARVRIQATSEEPVLTDANGQFTISDVPAGSVTVTAVLSYDPDRPINYITASALAEDGDSIQISLPRLPANDAAYPYDPGTSFTCSSCHNEQHAEWQDSTHSNAALNEWVLDLFSGTGTPGGSEGYVFRDSHDPDDNGFCAACHAPIEDAQTPGGVFLDEVTLLGGLDGVTCVACHQMAHVNDNVEALHHYGNTQYRFPQSNFTALYVWGPLDDVSFSTMRASHQEGFKEAKFCASCHEYNNPYNGMPGQNTYTEWLASPYAQPGDDFRACQDCHMPAATEPGPISSLGGQPIRPPEQRRSHRFTGATPTTLTDAIELDMVATQIGSTLEVTALVSNAGAGHAFPTGISLRNAILVIEASVDGQPLAQIQGDVVPFYGSASGGDDEDDLAGLPGKGFARVLEGRINGQGPVVRPVLFIDAESVWSDTRVPSGETDQSIYGFDLAGVPEDSEVDISARLLYRRAWRDTVVTKGWTTTPRGGPIEIEVGQVETSVLVSGIVLPPEPEGPVFPVPSLNHWAMLVLALALVLVGYSLLRRGPV
jgi:hypothetical protein